MQIDNLITTLSIIGLASTVFYAMFRVSKYAFVLNSILLSVLVFYLSEENELIFILLYLVCPLMLINIGLYVFLHKTESPKNSDSKYQVNFATTKGNFRLDNIKRGASIIGSAGSGKTESVVFGFLKHFEKEGFCGIIHDYKDFELTEMAYPLFKDSDIPFKVISFDKIIH
ncbi:MAG: type IV secretory system conjugative DNA transfer family protein, partial [Maribacter sp.]|nr:type IV secretory system conjugative DNA transfer family protein [Maribacter sp.]